MPVTVHYEESTEIVLDTEIVAEETGWTFGAASVNRIGALVALHLECTFADGAAANVAILPPDFRPAANTKSGNGSFSIDASTGQITYPGSTSGGGTAILDVVYQAGTLSP